MTRVAHIAQFAYNTPHKLHIKHTTQKKKVTGNKTVSLVVFSGFRLFSQIKEVL